MEDDVSEMEPVARLFSGISHPSRIRILYGVREGKTMQEVADTLEVTRGGLQDHIERMVTAELIYRPEDGTYALTPFGTYLVELLESDGDTLQDAFEILDDEQDTVEEEFDSADLPIDDRTREKSVHTETWKRAKDRIQELLEESR